MKYLLISALLLCGAFFSSFPAFSADTLNCELGETPLISVNGCGKPAPEESCSLVNIKVSEGFVSLYGSPYNYSSISAIRAKASSSDFSGVVPSCTYYSNKIESTAKTTVLSAPVPSCPPDTVTVVTGDATVTTTTERTKVVDTTGNKNCTYTALSPIVSSSTHEFEYTFEKSGEYECPEDYPIGPVEIDSGTTIGKYCYRIPEPQPAAPCDCNDYRGDGVFSFDSIIAPVGTYNSTDNMPQCLTLSRANPDDIGGDMLQCECQVSAKKWLSFSAGTENGVEMERWQPYPVAKDQPSGTITGVTCADTNGTLEPPEDAPKDCYTLKSGVKWCWADPAEKCTVINGQEQCSTGCGYVNGDFVCYQDNDPVLPDRTNDDLNDIDDNITDPDKTMPDITKRDLKQIQSGTEQRLDNVVISLGNNNNQLQNIGDKITETNKNLDGIGQQLDGQGKSLKGIQDGIDGLGDAFGDDGEPDGGGLGSEGTWYESEYPDGIVGIWNEHSAALQQTPMFDFLNQFQIAPDGTQPDMNFCFNLGALGDLGCKSVEVPAIVWVFLKLCILITAAFTCRALIFGG